LRRGEFFTGAVNERGLADVTWHGSNLDSPDWDNPEARTLSLTLAGFDGDCDIHVMLNMHWESQDFDLPEVPGRTWFCAVDTALAPPLDFADPGEEQPVEAGAYHVQGRSVVVLVNGAPIDEPPEGGVTETSRRGMPNHASP
jgi:glycogen operon protein